MVDKLNTCQKRAIKEWNKSIPFDFMHIERINTGDISFAQAWNENVQWLNDWVFETTSGINLKGCGVD